jgi:hypothetical protein
MDDCTSASGAARWRNVRGDRDNGTDSDFIPLSLQVPESGILGVEVLYRFQRYIWFSPLSLLRHVAFGAAELLSHLGVMDVL